jgi:hypothetical protein
MHAGLKGGPNSTVKQRAPPNREHVSRKADSSKIARKPGGHGDRLARRVEPRDSQAPCGPPLPAEGRQPAQQRVRLALGPERHHVDLRRVPQLR